MTIFHFADLQQSVQNLVLNFQRIDAKPQNMISEGLKILAFLQLKLRWPANPGQGPEGAVARRRVACRALSGAGLAAQYLST